MSDHVRMRMYAAILPPPAVLEDLAAVVRSVPGCGVELAAVPAHLLHLPLGNFGNVSVTDRIELREALASELAALPPMQLRFAGGAALVTDGDDSVWAHVGGDVDELSVLGALVPRVVQRLGFLIDRRVFRTRMRVGRITDATSLEFLERMLQRLDGYVGPAWTVHDVALLRHLSGEDPHDEGALELMHLLTLGGGKGVERPDEESTGAVPAADAWWSGRS